MSVLKFIETTINPETHSIDLKINGENCYTFGNLNQEVFVDVCCNSCGEKGDLAIAMEYNVSNGIYPRFAYCNECFNKEFVVMKKC